MIHSSYNIALLEFDKHWDCADGFARIIYESPHQLTIFCDSYIQSSLSPFKHNEKVNFVVKTEHESIEQFLLKNRKAIEKADLIFIDTIHTNPKTFLQLPFNRLVVLRVHNAFKQFAPLKHVRIPLSPFYIRKAIPYIVRELILNRFLFYTNRLNSRIHYFTFLSESITAYVATHKLASPKKTLFTLPILPWEKTDHKKPKDKIIISIVGSTDRRRKDYAPIMDSLISLFGKNVGYALPVELYLLGNSSGKYGRRISSALDAVNSPHFKCYHYTNEVPIREFDTILKDTHMIISPLQVNNITQIYGEIYGKTKFTASIGTIIKYNMIGLFPTSFEFDPAFEPYLLKYNSSHELSATLNQLLSHPEMIFKQLVDQSHFLSIQYDKQKLLHSLESFIEAHKKT